MSSVLKILPEEHNFPTYAIPFPGASKASSFLLSAATDVSVSIPAGFNIALFSFSAGTDVWVDYAAITLPPNDTPVSGTKQLNPQIRWLDSTETTLYFQSDTTAYVQVSFYIGDVLT